MATKLLKIEQVRENTLEVQIKQVNEIIQKQIDRSTGHSAVLIDFTLMDSTIEALQKEGYKVLKFEIKSDEFELANREMIAWGNLDKVITLDDSTGSTNSKKSNEIYDKLEKIKIFYNRLKEEGYSDMLALETALIFTK